MPIAITTGIYLLTNRNSLYFVFFIFYFLSFLIGRKGTVVPVVGGILPLLPLLFVEVDFFAIIFIFYS